jgi:hypothetical protein
LKVIDYFVLCGVRGEAVREPQVAVEPGIPLSNLNQSAVLLISAMTFINTGSRSGHWVSVIA